MQRVVTPSVAKASPRWHAPRETLCTNQGIRVRPVWQMRLAPCQCGGSSSSSSSSASAADIATAWTMLKQFSEQEFKGMAQQYLGNASSRAKLREALMLAYLHPCAEESWSPSPSPEVLLGVVASEARLAVRALRDWCQALGLQYVQPDCKVTGAASLAAVKGAVYVKYNSTTKVCYLSQYQGRDRGVLVQLGSGRLLGHFPLGFFDEAMANPEPSIGQQVITQDTPASSSSSSSSSTSNNSNQGLIC